MPTLASLNMAWKLLISGFLIVLSCGFAVAHMYLDHVTEMADGKPGLSMDDITFQFYGDRTKTTLKKMVNGSMKKFFSETSEPEKLTPEEQADLNTVLAWNDSGAKEEGFWNPKNHDDKNAKLVLNVIDRHGCLGCHGPDGKKFKDAPLDTFTAVSRVTRGDEGMDVGRL